MARRKRCVVKMERGEKEKKRRDKLWTRYSLGNPQCLETGMSLPLYKNYLITLHFNSPVVGCRTGDREVFESNPARFFFFFSFFRVVR